ncbi:hypothetical protein EB815_25670 [Mesorhizobium loti]|nr:hypothetical protein EB815_25670 [Mesorhizobium loti]
MHSAADRVRALRNADDMLRATGLVLTDDDELVDAEAELAACQREIDEAARRCRDVIGECAGSA